MAESKTKINGQKVKLLNNNIKNPNYSTNKRQIFIIGAKGIPASYGGFETFVEKLTENQVSPNIHYHVARMATDKIRYEYNGAKCFDIKVPNIGAAKAIYYDIMALKHCIQYCKNRPSIKKPVFYVLACRIGPFISYFKRKIKKLGGSLYVNPDGHEWLRAKWSAPVKKYWKISERLMVKHADLLICDSKNIEKYILNQYKKYNPKTTFIAYGSDYNKSILKNDDKTFTDWLNKNKLTPNGYYLMVGRFVPENSFETIISEFMNSDTKRDLVIITTVNESLFAQLESKLHFSRDKRIKFVGTVYNAELLKKIREQAFAYFHGHTVGGTNPSLLEALSATNLNLLVDVGFNREVAEDAALYWGQNKGELVALINKAEHLTNTEIENLGNMAKDRIINNYSWEFIVNSYEKLFLK
ncbi:MAG: DUF1972 domain-containing protein [Clostridia bacterium]|nr:DUF1972 domain-containing protein [Clostridia bacterium]